MSLPKLSDARFLHHLRHLGLVEGTSTLLLFGIAMPMKYVWGMPQAVRIMGSLHGFLFIALAIMCMIAIKRVPIGRKLGAAGILGAVVPFGPFVVDVWLRRLAHEAGGHDGEGCNSPETGGICFEDFARIELRVGRIISAEVFAEARKPAYLLRIDFGEALGVRKSSAQLTGHYSCEDLLDRLVVAVLNLPPKQIGPIQSQCLVTGFHDEQGRVALCIPEREVPLGTKLL